MARKKKNKVRKKRIMMKMETVKNASGILLNRNVIFGLLTVIIFFGLVLGAQYQLNNGHPGTGLKLSVAYKGDHTIGRTLSAKGRAFLVEKGVTSVKCPGLLEAVYSFYSRLPEVNEVHFVRRKYPDRIEVKVELREPFVRVGTTYFDRSGCRLSREFSRSVKPESLPEIKGLRYPRTLAAGDVWSNACFNEVLSALEAVENRLLITEVIIPQARSTRGIDLRTAEGASVYWGQVFMEGTDPGVTVDRKIRNLDEALKIIASNMNRVRYADISHDKPVIAFK